MIYDLGLNHYILDDVKKYKERKILKNYYYYYNYIDCYFKKNQVLFLL